MAYYGVAYGYVAATEFLLLLHVDRADPRTLFCHPCAPNEYVGEVSVEGGAEKMVYTAVVQLTCLFLSSLQSDTFRGALLEAALDSVGAALEKWAKPCGDAAHFFSAEDTESSVAASPSPRQRAD